MSELLKLNVNEHVEKKGGLSYLSWAWAWAEVLKHDPEATWEPVLFGQPDGTNSACLWLGDTALVQTRVTIKGKTRSCMLPVMDNRNNAVKSPDARKVSDAIMRCMTKAIAMHGLGLYIYAGEDLPESDKAEDEDLTPILQASIDANAVKLKEAARTTGMKVRAAIQEHLANGRDMGALGEWEGLRRLQNGEEVAGIVWNGLTTPERDEIRRLQNEAKQMATADPVGY